MLCIKPIKCSNTDSNENEKEAGATRVNLARMAPCVAHTYTSQEQEEVLKKE